MARPMIVAEHGTNRRYQQGCRCRPCRDANSRWFAEYSRDRRLGEGNPITSRRHDDLIDILLELLHP